MFDGNMTRCGGKTVARRPGINCERQPTSMSLVDHIFGATLVHGLRSILRHEDLLSKRIVLLRLVGDAFSSHWRDVPSSIQV